MAVDSSQAMGKLFPETPCSFKIWRELFINSSAVHFFNKRTSSLVVFDDPRYSAYALLGPHYCPLSYHSTKFF